MRRRVSQLLRRVIVALRSVNLHTRSVGMMLIASIIPILIIGVGAYSGALRVFELSNYNSIQKSVDLYGILLDNTLSQYIAIGSEVATNIETINLIANRETKDASYYARLGRYNSYLERNKLRYLSTIEILPENGETLFYPYLYSDPARPAGGIYQTAMASPERTVWFGLARPENQDFASAPPRSLYRMETSILISTKIRSPYSQKNIGIVNVAVSSDVLRNIMESAIEHETDGTFPFKLSSIFIVDEQGFIISNYDEALIGSMLPGEYSSALTDSSSLRNYRVKDQQSGHTALLFYTNSQKTGFRIISVIDYRDFVKDLTNLQQVILVLVVLLLVFASAFSYLHTLSIRRPIDQIVSGMRNVEQGELSVHVIDQGRDELSYLTERFNAMVAQIKELLGKTIRIESQKQQAEMSALEAQINPHFLYNTLDMISWMAYQSKTEEIIKMIESLSSFFRLSLNAGKRTYSIQDELAHVHAYIDIQLERFKSGQRIDYHFDVDPRALGCQTVKILLQPLVENALLHGLLPKAQGGNIWICVLRQDDELRLSVSDDGVGLDEAKAPSANRPFKSEYGLSSIDARVRLFYGEGYGLTITDRDGGGTLVTIRLPAVDATHGPDGSNGGDDTYAQNPAGG